MNIVSNKNRTPLGEVLFAQSEWRRMKIKADLLALGLSEGRWRGIHERVEAHLLPAYVRDVIVKELPQTAPLFEHPKLKCELV
ncbi:hypothetical protein DYBT9275_00939 [Dyadobacter sp. CECT 9275]|uniref:Uncharacterized protein n=1 Tax=Dyadobacter helix TaxID=2822344 RepID=A0A916NB70_9BACT|nr:hypothetical protein [Dyadobacter sp. CECT 9275]CAG4992321.1 hypothetical protein DYBT9275_00939 [Dyadobacter sp. CECT 9275]